MFTQAHIWGQVTFAGSAFIAPPLPVACPGAVPVWTLPLCRPVTPSRVPSRLPACRSPRGSSLPVFCAHGLALCRRGSWHPYLGFSDISTCFFNFVIISDTRVGRALWRTRVSPLPTCPSCWPSQHLVHPLIFSLCIFPSLPPT